MKDYYFILRVDPAASEEVIKASYRALVKKYHPDSVGDAGQKKVDPAVADALMKELNEAKDILLDPEKRAAYDRECGFVTEPENDIYDIEKMQQSSPRREFNQSAKTTAKPKNGEKTEFKRPSSEQSTEELVEKGFRAIEEGNFTFAVYNFDLAIEKKPSDSKAHLGRLLARNGAKTVEELAKAELPLEHDADYLAALAGDNKAIVAELTRIAKNLTRNRNDYEKALCAESEAEDETDYLFAENMFKKLSDYRDAEDHAVRCHTEAEKCRQEKLYREALILMEKGTDETLLAAAKSLEKIAHWKDAKVLAEKCRATLSERQADNQKQLDEALALRRKAILRAEKKKKFPGWIVWPAVVIIALIAYLIGSGVILI